ncbi:hypothetical protein NDU88_005498 [Pleurodeles waltl]|uniref:Uncharacterized protein n=1 Tax=Pleurodeles waltl TaxID=8319 RepID=A0AAV7QI97_PLEWA|nr:hypothetical protein NDU88_005498 [Pleurodeles waltl]
MDFFFHLAPIARFTRRYSNEDTPSTAQGLSVRINQLPSSLSWYTIHLTVSYIGVVQITTGFKTLVCRSNDTPQQPLPRTEEPVPGRRVASWSMRTERDLNPRGAISGSRRPIGGCAPQHHE